MNSNDPRHISTFPPRVSPRRQVPDSHDNTGGGNVYSELSVYNISDGKTIKSDWWRDEDDWVCWGSGGGGGTWIWLSVYPCLRTSWRHKCQLWAVCGLPTKLLARTDPDWFYLLDSWHATHELWPSMCHSNATASQSPLTSVFRGYRG